MTVERWLRLIAGVFVLASLGLAYVHSPYWMLLTAFVGVNLPTRIHRLQARDGRDERTVS